MLPEFPSNRVCIKIPSTWEGIQACKVLEQEGVVTLATTLFSMEQAAAAHLAGCSYIACLNCHAWCFLWIDVFSIWILLEGGFACL